MAFEGLSEKLQAVFKKLTGKGRLSEADVKEAMREVRIALLEADVNYKVVKDFIKTVSERAVGQDILVSLTPGQQVIKIVSEEMTKLMGGTHSRLTVSSRPPTVIMLCGLQGAGKTTMAAKLGMMLKKQGKKPLLAACDIYRPAAIKQLQVVGEQAGVPVFEQGTQDPVLTAKNAINEANRLLYDTVIVDTAGRLHIDEALMQELDRVKSAVNPAEVLLVVDAMTGQDAVNVAEEFNRQLGLTGVILTKLDGDTRGGAALSVRAVTGQPIKFAGIGEKLQDIEPFHPERMASRVLGMGDVMSLIEKAQSAFDEKQAEQLEQKIRTQRFTLEDFLTQFEQIRKMGGASEVLNMLPGSIGKQVQGEEVDEKQLDRMEAIIFSMTRKERNDPGILNASRKKRIAAGSGTSVQQVNQLLRQFEMMQKMIKQFAGNKRFGKRGRMKLPF